VPRSPYLDLHHRVVLNVEPPENEQSCWLWPLTTDRSGYGRLNVYIPQLGETKMLMVHIVVWLFYHAKVTTVDDLWDHYQTLRLSGLELDHLCRTQRCCNVDHLEPVTPAENVRRRDARRGLPRL
jgi:hypothetical protein